MSNYKIADIVIEMNPKEETLVKQSKEYLVRTQTESIQIKLDIPREFLEDRQRQNPHLTIDDCEYIWYGVEFYKQLIQFQGMMLHASAIAYKGRAYLFSAPSGTGKSTHTNLWKEVFKGQAVIINDDKPALRCTDGDIYVYGTPFSGKTDLNLNIKVPLQAICFIERSASNWIEVMTAEEAIFSILNQTIRPIEEKQMEKLLELLNQILSKIKVYHMGCNISEEAVELAYQTMGGDN